MRRLRYSVAMSLDGVDTVEVGLMPPARWHRMLQMTPIHRTAALVIGLALAFAGPAAAQTTSGKAVDEVLAFEREGCLAYERNDAAAIDRLVADGYVLTNSRGGYDTKADDLAAARNKTVRFSTFHNEDMKVRVFGDTAIVTGRTIVKGVARDGALIDLNVLFTDTVVRLNGRWQLVAGHVSRPAAAAEVR